jgi:hypothetical protein
MLQEANDLPVGYGIWLYKFLASVGCRINAKRLHIFRHGHHL